MITRIHFYGLPMSKRPAAIEYTRKISQRAICIFRQRHPLSSVYLEVYTMESGADPCPDNTRLVLDAIGGPGVFK